MTWSVMLLAAVGTLLIRIPVAALSTDWTPRPWVARRLDALAPAAVAALLTVSLAGSHGSLHVPSVAQLAAVGVAAAVMRRTSTLVLALGAGLGTVLLLG